MGFPENGWFIYKGKSQTKMDDSGVKTLGNPFWTHHLQPHPAPGDHTLFVFGGSRCSKAGDVPPPPSAAAQLHDGNMWKINISAQPCQVGDAPKS